MEIWCHADGRAARIRISPRMVTQRVMFDGMTVGVTHDGRAAAVTFERLVTDAAMEQAIARFPELAALRGLNCWRLDSPYRDQGRGHGGRRG